MLMLKMIGGLSAISLIVWGIWKFYEYVEDNYLVSLFDWKVLCILAIPVLLLGLYGLLVAAEIYTPQAKVWYNDDNVLVGIGFCLIDWLGVLIWNIKRTALFTGILMTIIQILTVLLIIGIVAILLFLLLVFLGGGARNEENRS